MHCAESDLALQGANPRTNMPDTRNQHGAAGERTLCIPARMAGLFWLYQTPSTLHRLDQWLRRRLRSALWTHWSVGARALRSFASEASDVTLPPKRQVVRMAGGELPTALLSPSPCPTPTSTLWGFLGWPRNSSTRRTAGYVRPVVSQGQRAAYLCEFCSSNSARRFSPQLK